MRVDHFRAIRHSIGTRSLVFGERPTIQEQQNKTKTDFEIYPEPLLTALPSQSRTLRLAVLLFSDHILSVLATPTVASSVGPCSEVMIPGLRLGTRKGAGRGLKSAWRKISC